MEPTFQPGVEPPEPMDDGPLAGALWFAFRGAELLVLHQKNREAITVPSAADPGELGLAIVRRQYLGHLGTTACWSAELAEDAEPPPGSSFLGLRALHGALPESIWAIAGRAAQIVAWERDHQFCGRCGIRTGPVPGERARRCPSCGQMSFPRVSPAVIVLIERGERILLARGRHFPPGRFGIVAGFVEPGETLEEAVRREVREEVGLELADLAYFGSQPWPFPHGIMIGFTATACWGEIRIDPTELAEAGWYDVDELPAIPPKLSIARRLIDAWAARRGRDLPEDAAWT